MSAGLQEKYPDLISLQGNGVNNKSADLRLDWDGTQLHGQLLYNGSTFLITPVATNSGIVYLFYDKNDSGEIKQPFESAPENDRSPGLRKKTMYDR